MQTHWTLIPPLILALSACDSAAPGDIGPDGDAADIVARDDSGDATAKGGDTPTIFDGGIEGDSASDADGSAPPDALALCPAVGPFGTSVGEVLPDVELSDCEGNSYPLHELCDRQAGYIFLYAGW